MPNPQIDHLTPSREMLSGLSGGWKGGLTTGAITGGGLGLLHGLLMRDRKRRSLMDILSDTAIGAGAGALGLGALSALVGGYRGRSRGNQLVHANRVVRRPMLNDGLNIKPQVTGGGYVDLSDGFNPFSQLTAPVPNNRGSAFNLLGE